MKKILFLSLLFIIIQSLEAQSTKNFETENYLVSTNPCDCIDISLVTNDYNPLDLYHGLYECVKKHDYDNAAKLFALANLYGLYDNYRVNKNAALNILTILYIDIDLRLDAEDSYELKDRVNMLLEGNPENLYRFCCDVKEIGKPSYEPSYIFNYRKNATPDNADISLIENFDSDASWDLAIKNFLHCDE